MVVPHEPRHPLVIHHQAVPPQVGRDPPIAIPTPMGQRDLLNLRAHRHLLVQRLRLLPRPVEPRPADRRQLTHALDTQAALL